MPTQHLTSVMFENRYDWPHDAIDYAFYPATSVETMEVLASAYTIDSLFEALYYGIPSQSSPPFLPGLKTIIFSCVDFYALKEVSLEGVLEQRLRARVKAGLGPTTLEFDLCTVSEQHTAPLAEIVEVKWDHVDVGHDSLAYEERLWMQTPPGLRGHWEMDI